jgi:hypothetical protein
MPVTYFKRFRMEIGLVGRDFSVDQFPDGYRLHEWDEALLEFHSSVKYRSFESEIDAHVFPCLGESDGCQRLMKEIAAKNGFLGPATWLVSWQGGTGEPIEFCGTVQGIRDHKGFGAIQNLGVVPEHRGQGLGGILLASALSGFQRCGLRKAYLEVTAKNKTAVRIYQRMGFVRVKTVYKAVERPRVAAHA